MKTIIDILILVILIYGAWNGYKKGLIMGILGVLVLTVSIYGANLLSNTFAYDLVPALKPFAGGFVEGLVDGEDGVLELMEWENEGGYSLPDLLSEHKSEHKDFAEECYKKMGISPAAAEVMAASAVEKAKEDQGDLMEAITDELCNRVSYVGCFTLAFLMIAIILTVVINLPNLSYKIPRLDLVNDIAGTLIGLATAAAYCAVLVWVLKFMGMIIGTETLADSALGGWFLEKDFISEFLGI